MIDIHSHILPQMDDGSESVDMSIKMLKKSAEYKTDIQIFTPHFYATRHRIDSFLEKRANSYNALKESLNKNSIENCPQILLGAEVAYFEGISNADSIKKLTIENTNSLLLEMPFDQWTGKEFDDIENLVFNQNLNVIIAHLDRYLSIRKNKDKIAYLLEMPVTIQLNASSFFDWKISKKLLKLVDSQNNIVLGSDCHDMVKRPPNLNEARSKILAKLGQNALDDIDKTALEIIKGC